MAGLSGRCLFEISRWLRTDALFPTALLRYKKLASYLLINIVTVVLIANCNYFKGFAF